MSLIIDSNSQLSRPKKKLLKKLVGYFFVVIANSSIGKNLSVYFHLASQKLGDDGFKGMGIKLLKCSGRKSHTIPLTMELVSSHV